MTGAIGAVGPDRMTMVGGVTHEDAWISTNLVRSSSSVRWVIARNGRVVLTTDAVSTTSAARSTNYNNNYAKVQVSDTGTLLPGLKYEYWPLIDGVEHPQRVRTFRTRWPRGTPGRLKYLYAACFRGVQRTNAQVAWAMKKQNADTLFIDGDLTYTDIVTDDIKLQRAALLWYFCRNPYWRQLLDTLIFEWMWDDHDGGGAQMINAGAAYGDTGLVLANTLAHFKEAFPHGDLVDAAIGTRVINDGVVDTVMLDCRTQKSQTNSTFLGNASSTFNQKDWLLNTYLPGLQARGIWQVVLDFSTMIDATNANDGLIASTNIAEFTEIIDAIRDTAGLPSIWIKYGDRHAIFANDGSGGADQSSGGGAQIVQWCSAGLEASSGMQGSPLSTTFNGRETFLGAVQRNFSTMEFNHLPRTQIVVKGFAEPFDDDNNATEVFSIDSTEVEHTVQFASSGGAAGTVNVSVLKNFAGPIGELDGAGDIGSVEYNSPSDGVSGTLKIRPNCGKYVIAGTFGSGHTLTLSSPVGVSLGAQTTYVFS